MKKILAIVLTLLFMTTMLIVTAFATTKTVDYYDKNGNRITINGMYYNSQGAPMYNAMCYYLDADGNPVHVGGCRAYYYDTDGNLVPGCYCYDQDGNTIPLPSSYPNGYGCGMWYYNSQGEAVNKKTYYDDFGNFVDPPVNNRLRKNYCGGRCAWR